MARGTVSVITAILIIWGFISGCASDRFSAWFFADSAANDVADYVNQGLFRIAELETWHFWFAERRVLVLRLLGRWLRRRHGTVLDLGCGTGSMLTALAREGYRAVGMDALHPRSQPGGGVAKGSRVILGDVTHPPIAGSRFDAVLLLDVLEHVDDDAVLSEVRRVLRPGGVLLLTVPAMPWLWSYRDTAAGHLRRYAYAHLRRVLAASGLRVRRIRYFNTVLLPLAMATRLLGRRTPRLRDAEERPGTFTNRILSLVLRAEVRLSGWLALPWGTSLVAVCQKE